MKGIVIVICYIVMSRHKNVNKAQIKLRKRIPPPLPNKDRLSAKDCPYGSHKVRRRANN